MALATRPKPQTQHKKRVGKHHKQGKQYLKAYWPYLPISAIVSLGVLVNAWLASPTAVLGAQSDLTSSSLLTSTNQQRLVGKERPLTLNSDLTTAATAKASDMVARNYWSHDAPDGKTPWNFIAAAGYNYQAAGENLAYGFSSANDVVRGWMNSAEHRANILNAAYQDVGFGVASSPNFDGNGPEVVVVAMYAQPVSSAVSKIAFQVKQTSPSSNVLGASVATAAQPVSRIQLLTGGAAPWSLALVLIISLAAISLLVIRHGRYWQRAVARGELFVVNHPWFDVSLVGLAVIAIILSHTAGFIH